MRLRSVEDKVLLHIIYTDRHKLHNTDVGQDADFYELPARAEAILSAVQAAHLGPLVAPTDHGLEPILAIHDPDYVRFLQTAYTESAAYFREAGPVLPWTFATRHAMRKPKSFMGLKGYYAFGAGTPILAAKFTALALNFTLGLLLAGAACYTYTLVLFEALDAGAWLALNGLLLLFLLTYAALTLLCSTLTRSQVVAGGLAFGLWIALSAVGALPQVGEWLPGQLTAWAAQLMNGGGDAAWPALLVSLGLIAGALGGAWIVLERQEL